MELELEAYIDENGLDEAISALADICYRKAEHIAIDPEHSRRGERYGRATQAALAKDWDMAGATIDALVVTPNVLRVCPVRKNV
jgi:hypothetical protein